MQTSLRGTFHSYSWHTGCTHRNVRDHLMLTRVSACLVVECYMHVYSYIFANVTCMFKRCVYSRSSHADVVSKGTCVGKIVATTRVFPSRTAECIVRIRYKYVSGTNLPQSRFVVPSMRLSRHLRFSGNGPFLSRKQPCVDIDLTSSCLTSLDALASPSSPQTFLFNTRLSLGPSDVRKNARPGPSLPSNSYVLASAISFDRKRRRKHAGN